jgi:hypothetical protein
MTSAKATTTLALIFSIVNFVGKTRMIWYLS